MLELLGLLRGVAAQRNSFLRFLLRRPTARLAIPTLLRSLLLEDPIVFSPDMLLQELPRIKVLRILTERALVLCLPGNLPFVPGQALAISLEAALELADGFVVLLEIHLLKVNLRTKNACEKPSLTLLFSRSCL